VSSRGPLERREFLGLLGFLALAACSSSTKKAAPGASTSTTARGVPPTIGPTTTRPTTTGPPSTRIEAPSTTVVAGSNAALDRATLASDAGTYNGAWHGTWAIDGGPSADVAGTITIDPDARTLTATVAAGARILGGDPLPKITISGSVDSFVYSADTGAFRIRQTTPVGVATLTNGDGPGAFVLSVVDIPGHPDIAEFRATGVANRPDAIPVRFEVHTTGGIVRTGSVTLQPG
jgi:hypothetical protein